MIRDGRSIPSGESLRADVCIIGAGPAGITIADELSGTGRQILVLEAGGVEPDPSTQQLMAGDNAGVHNYPLEESRFAGVGGSSLGWAIDLGDDLSGARYAPLDDIDFERREWMPHSGWPFSRSYLDPYYRRAGRVVGIGEQDFDADLWLDAAQTPYLLWDDAIEPKVFRFASSRVFTKTHRQALSDLPDVTIVHHTSAVTVDLDPHGTRVTAISAATLSGNRFTVEAQIFVLAAGGVENARLLLVSDAVHSTGVGNGNDLVGRFFMDHPHFVTGILVPSNPALLTQQAHSTIHEISGVAVQRKFRLSDELCRSLEVGNYVFRLTPSPWTNATRYQAMQPPDGPGMAALRRLATSWRTDHRLPKGAARDLRLVAADSRLLGAAAWSRSRWEVTKRVRPRPVGGAPALYQLHVMSEQAPNPASRVTLSDEVNELGMRLLDPACRRPTVTWTLSDVDLETALTAQEVIRARLEGAGIGAVRTRVRRGEPIPNLLGGYHHMGTTRMHADPRHGVVDTDCAVHGVPNLFVAGSSVFPTSGAANPTLTIVALALRVADRLKTALVAPKVGTGALRLVSPSDASSRD